MKRKWLEPLDDIKEKEGITDLTGKRSARYFGYCRRRDVPLQFARHCQAAAGDDPDDVVMLVKASMADTDLQQAVLTICRVGASWKLGRAPPSWLERDPFGAEYVRKLRLLGEQISKHFPMKATEMKRRTERRGR